MFFPVLGDPYYQNTRVILPMEGVNDSTTFTDFSPSPKTVTPYGNVKISTAQSKWGAGSGYFDGTGDYLVAPLGVTLTGDFTIECWVYPTQTAAVSRSFFHVNAGGAAGVHVYQNGTSLLVDNGSSADYSGASLLALNTWKHIALCRSGTSLKIFTDGILQNTRTAQSYGSPTQVQVGRFFSGGITSDWMGYIQDVRITHGIARYSANFSLLTDLSFYPNAEIRQFFPRFQPSAHLAAQRGL